MNASLLPGVGVGIKAAQGNIQQQGGKEFA